MASGSSSRTSASRSSPSSAATSVRRFGGRSVSALARSAGRISSIVASRCVAPWPVSSVVSPVTSLHSSTWVGPRRPKRLPALVHGDVGDVPVAARVLIHGEVVDGAAAAVAEGDGAVEQLVDGEGLGLVLLELADVQHAGGDDLAGVERRDAGDGQEHPAASQDLDHQTDDAGPSTVGAHGDDDVAELAHLVARGVEDRLPDDAGQEDPTGRGAHAQTLPAHWRPVGEASGCRMREPRDGPRVIRGSLTPGGTT